MLKMNLEDLTAPLNGLCIQMCLLISMKCGVHFKLTFLHPDLILRLPIMCHGNQTLVHIIGKCFFYESGKNIIFMLFHLSV